MGFNIGFKDIIDIFLVAFLLYQAYKILKKTGAGNVFIGILTFIIIWFMVSFVFKMELLGGILDRLMSVGAFGLIVLFQDEIKRFFSRLGARRNWKFINIFKRLFGTKKTEQKEYNLDLAQIITACKNLSKNSMGALIVIKRDSDLNLYIQSGDIIDANINARLIENIFFKNSPLHDGAMIIYGRQIKAAGCILPVSKSQSIPKRLGLRHRAALGITETTDAIAIIVSEETGKMSWAVNGEISVNVKPEQLEQFLTAALANQ
ncbi:TIGR00159 family protein [Paludibacter sp. 221]|uniref:diadenylate cyclase CdaA n=1 Tax=Paludibacter sp. 221 TaxID=2302939 RepID=UPI0013D6C65C|nr:diadenylate cyclase CdaA [Paludibacter sp. 221]NDV45654.1 TIGR00159 family protein [Paludibacter sp. 221]